MSLIERLDIDTKRFYSTAEVAEMLGGVSTETIRRLIEEGKLEAVKVRTAYRIHGWSLQYYASKL